MGALGSPFWYEKQKFLSKYWTPNLKLHWKTIFFHLLDVSLTQTIFILFFSYLPNYYNITNFLEVKKLFEDNIKNLYFTNDLTKDWGKTTLELVKKCKTSYVFYLLEDLKKYWTRNNLLT